MEVKVYGRDGQEAGRTVALDASVFDVAPNDHVVWLDVRRIQAAARQGTHKARERSETAGSGRKLYRQKGTGFARAGDAKSPLRRSGGTFFGPQPRNYGIKVNKKSRQLARRSALTYKARGEAVRVVENLDLEAPSTRALRDLVEAMELAGQKVLLLTAGHDGPLYLSSRNLPRVTVRDAAQASTLDVLHADVVVLLEGALDVLTNLLGTDVAVEA